METGARGVSLGKGWAWTPSHPVGTLVRMGGERGNEVI